MPEYIKLKSVIRILDNVMSDENIKHKGKAIRKRLKELPKVDVEKVVRCKNCKHLNEKGICEKFRQRYPFYPEDDFYCGFGKKKEGAGE